MIDDLFPDLPIDGEVPSRAFRPYRNDAATAWHWLKEHAGIIALIAGLVIGI